MPERRSLFRTAHACLTAGLLLGAFVAATPAEAEGRGEETTAETICRLIEGAAAAEALPVDFLTRLIWRESSFRTGVTSHAGAQGIAQFMPGTAAERGLEDPFDPEQAIPASAGYLRDLRNRLGNLGLAAAAYNGGPTRLASWLSNGGWLPGETADYVFFVTGRTVEDWRDNGTIAPPAPQPAPLRDPRPSPPPPKRPTCASVVATIAREAPRLVEGPYAPFGVQLSGNFSKARAIAAYQRQVTRFPALLQDRPTIILGSRSAGRGRRAFYRVRMPVATLKAAQGFCTTLRKAGGACVVLRN